jgi:ATP-dependent exoDNAse (exonuclease V) alpha subunit
VAIYHCCIKIISRGKGKSAVAAAAYRSGERITNSYDGVTHDYTRKRGIAHTEVLLPGNAPREFKDRGVLWNSVEKTEKQKNSQLSREIEIALPSELAIEENISLARRFVKEQFVDKGMCADVAVHDKGDGNPHAHILLTLRPFNEDGTWGAKVVKINGIKNYTVDWDNRDNAELWRSRGRRTATPLCG